MKQFNLAKSILLTSILLLILFGCKKKEELISSGVIPINTTIFDSGYIIIPLSGYDINRIDSMVYEVTYTPFNSDSGFYMTYWKLPEQYWQFVSRDFNTGINYIRKKFGTLSGWEHDCPNNQVELKTKIIRASPSAQVKIEGNFYIKGH